jgi:hypothetical protein
MRELFLIIRQRFGYQHRTPCKCRKGDSELCSKALAKYGFLAWSGRVVDSRDLTGSLQPRDHLLKRHGDDLRGPV